MSFDAPEARAFAARSRVAYVATHSPRGAPFVTPLWFVVHGGRICCTTSAASLTVRNLELDPRAVLLLHVEGEDRVLRVRGRASVRRGWLPPGVLLRMAARYYLAPAAVATELRHAGLWGLRLRYYAQAGPALLAVEPESAAFVRRPA